MTGLNPKDMQAHHIFPKKFRKYFEDRGLDIDNPHFGVWIENHWHLSKAKAYNEEWKKFKIDNPNATSEDIMNFANELMNKIYGQ